MGFMTSVIPGWCVAPDPESRDSGFDAAHRPGMTTYSLRLRHPWWRGGGDETCGFEHGGAERGRDGHAERNQDARAGDRHEGDLEIALGGEISDHGPIGDIARDRREIDRADHGRPVIAALGPDHFHA